MTKQVAALMPSPGLKVGCSEQDRDADDAVRNLGQGGPTKPAVITSYVLCFVQDVTSSFRRLARQHHPDKGGNLAEQTIAHSYAKRCKASSQAISGRHRPSYFNSQSRVL